MHARQYHSKTDEELSKLTVNHLRHILKASRWDYVTCGCTYHCGDEWLSPDDRQYNSESKAFQQRVTAVLTAKPQPVPVVNPRIAVRGDEKKKRGNWTSYKKR